MNVIKICSLLPSEISKLIAFHNETWETNKREERCKWLNEGDANAAYLYKIENRPSPEDSIITGIDAIYTHIFNHFKSIVRVIAGLSHI